MTAFPARRMGFYNRGIIAPHMAADIILVDMQRIRDKATLLIQMPDRKVWIWLWLTAV